jgi:hypothetical protein
MSYLLIRFQYLFNKNVNSYLVVSVLMEVVNSDVIYLRYTL